MDDLDFSRIDLNLLRVLVALAEEGSVTSAGDRLGLAQSTVSHALSRLRNTLGDPLFVRSTYGVQPTALAAGMVPAINRAFEIVQDAIDEHRCFDPLTSRRSFTLLMTDVGEMLFVPPLIARLRSLAPNIRLIIRQIPRDRYKEALENGEADIAIGQLPLGQIDLSQQLLSEEHFDGYARTDHPILAGPNLDAFMDAYHLIIGPPAVSENHIQRAMGALAQKRKIALELRHYMPAAFVLANTDLIAVLPRTVSVFLSTFDSLTRFKVPLEIKPVTMRQFWHGRSTNDDGNRWLRGQIAELFQHRRG